MTSQPYRRILVFARERIDDTVVYFNALLIPSSSDQTISRANGVQSTQVYAYTLHLIQEQNM